MMDRMIELKCKFCGQPALRCTQKVIDAAKKRGLRAACEGCAVNGFSEEFLDEFEDDMECVA